ncbi:MAG: Maf family protein [Candidatus Lokiarchaeota archaeon]|jgi:septum formation protein
MKKVILASGSGDRRALLERLAIPFDILITNVNEEKYKTRFENPIELVMKLAENKAKTAKKLMNHDVFEIDDLIIAADTIIEYDGQIIGKAKNKDQAYMILKTLNNSTHNLITGIAITQFNDSRIITDFERTKVTFMNLTNKEIQTYIDFGEWKGRAGAYSIFDKASMLIKKIEGSPSNVIGLPIQKIYHILKNEFSINLMDLSRD